MRQKMAGGRHCIAAARTGGGVRSKTGCLPVWPVGTNILISKYYINWCNLRACALKIFSVVRSNLKKQHIKTVNLHHGSRGAAVPLAAAREISCSFSLESLWYFLYEEPSHRPEARASSSDVPLSSISLKCPILKLCKPNPEALPCASRRSLKCCGLASINLRMRRRLRADVSTFVLWG